MSKKAAPTLIDTLYRASFRNERNSGWTENAKWRDALRRAKKFVLDDEMSTFLGELGTQAFVNAEPTDEEFASGKIAERKVNVRNRMIEHLRMGARLPGEVTWIEYNLRNCQKRSQELLGRECDLSEMPAREGWLLMRHPTLPTAFRAHIVSHDPDIDHGDGFDTWTFPVALGWTADMETILPWQRIPFSGESNSPSEISTGLLGYKSERASFVFSDMLVTPNQPKAMADLLREWSGVQRRMWALLSTINDLPVEVTEVRASKGFIAKGAYRKFLDHKTLTLTVPQKLYRKTIRDALSLVHRRGGPVREHWRKDWRHPLSPLCDHIYGADEKHMFCEVCKGRKIWVDAHVRGDTSRGFVTHDFIVTHEVEK
jgi:hypothetical protein